VITLREIAGLGDDDKQGYNEPDPAPPEMPIAFDADHRPCAVAHPVYEEPEPPDWLREDRLRTIRLLLEALTAHGTAMSAGEHAYGLAWLCNVRPFKSQRELAAFLGVSEGRASQIMGRLAVDFPDMANLKRRQKKPRR